MKVSNFVMLFVTMALIFNLAGIMIPGVNGVLHLIGITDADGNMFDSEGNLNLTQHSILYWAVLALLTVGTGFAIFTGTFSRARLENFMLAQFLGTTLLITFSAFLISVLITAASYGKIYFYISLIIIGPLQVLWLMSCAEYIRGGE